MFLGENQGEHVELTIEAGSEATEIWLGDDGGHFVQTATGTLRTHLLPGDYTVEFGLGTTCYPIALREPLRLTQQEIEAGPSCPRPEVRF